VIAVSSPRRRAVAALTATAVSVQVVAPLKQVRRPICIMSATVDQTMYGGDVNAQDKLQKLGVQ
jgi:hypothetical protein